MTEYNIFIVAGPLHILNSIEVIEHFKSKNNILLILSTNNKKQAEQMEKMLHFIDWHTVKYILLPLKKIDKMIFVQVVDNILKNIDKNAIKRVVVGEYRSDHVNHIVNYFSNQNIYLVDDGLAQLDYHNDISQISLKVKIRRFIYRLIGYKLNPIKYTFFTIFDIENEQIIKNNYTFFKKNISNKNTEDLVYFIGQPLVELNMISEKNYKNELSKIIDFYNPKIFVYILHRREDEDKIKRIAKELNFEFREFSNLIEIEMINSTYVPSDFATFFSTAIVTLPYFIKESKYRVFRSHKKYINSKHIDNIETSYQEFEHLGLKVEVL